MTNKKNKSKLKNYIKKWIDESQSIQIEKYVNYKTNFEGCIEW
jgi:ribosomal protein S20